MPRWQPGEFEQWKAEQLALIQAENDAVRKRNKQLAENREQQLRWQRSSRRLHEEFIEESRRQSGG